MNLSLGCLFLFLGAVCLHFASHPTQAVTPWEMYMQILGKLSGKAFDGEQA